MKFCLRSDLGDARLYFVGLAPAPLGASVVVSDLIYNAMWFDSRDGAQSCVDEVGEIGPFNWSISEIAEAGASA